MGRKFKCGNGWPLRGDLSDSQTTWRGVTIGGHDGIHHWFTGNGQQGMPSNTGTTVTYSTDYGQAFRDRRRRSQWMRSRTCCLVIVCFLIDNFGKPSIPIGGVLQVVQCHIHATLHPSIQQPSRTLHSIESDNLQSVIGNAIDSSTEYSNRLATLNSSSRHASKRLPVLVHDKSS